MKFSKVLLKNCGFGGPIAPFFGTPYSLICKIERNISFRVNVSCDNHTKALYVYSSLKDVPANVLNQESRYRKTRTKRSILPQFNHLSDSHLFRRRRQSGDENLHGRYFSFNTIQLLFLYGTRIHTICFMK